MIALEKKEALTYVGGGSISAAFLNACASLFKTVYNFGVNLGSAIKRAVTKNYCTN